MLSVFPVYTLDEIWDLIASVSECFLPTLTKQSETKRCRWNGTWLCSMIRVCMNCSDLSVPILRIVMVI